MPLELSQQKALIFRITHRDNVPWILDNGMHCRNGVFDPNYRNIGNTELIDKRSQRVVPEPPGGTLNDYVPFYFTPYSIMMLNIVTGYGVPRLPKDDVVIFVSSLAHATAKGVRVVFTNQHAYPRMARYYSDIRDLGKVDWPLLQARDFKKDPDDPGKKERYQAEALLWKHVPLTALQGVCCYTAAVQHRLQQEVARRNLAFKVGLQSNWYH